MKPSKELIQQAIAKGIVETAVIQSATGSNDPGQQGDVIPVEYWITYQNEKHLNINPYTLVVGTCVDGSLLLAKNGVKWAKVLSTPSGSRGLQPDDAVRGSRVMINAIIDLMIELGLAEERFRKNYRGATGLTWMPEHAPAPLQWGVHSSNMHHPEVFMAKARVTAEEIKSRNKFTTVVNGHETQVNMMTGQILIDQRAFSFDTIKQLAKIVSPEQPKPPSS